MEATRFTEIVIFDTFACLGLFLNLVVLAPTLFAGVCRKVPWASLILSFILYAITYMLLIGRQRPTQHPPYGLCFFQASLVYSVPLLCAISYTCFAIDFCLQMSIVDFGGLGTKTRSRTENVVGKQSSWTKWNHELVPQLVILPWAAFCIQNLFVASLGMSNPSIVQRSATQFYCAVTSTLPATINCISVITCAVIVVPLDIYMTYVLCRNSGTTRRLSEHSQTDITFSLYIRLILFTLVGGVAFGLSVAHMTRLGGDSSVWETLLTTVPVIGAIVFGTQADIVESYIPRKGKHVSSNNEIV